MGRSGLLTTGIVYSRVLTLERRVAWAGMYEITTSHAYAYQTGCKYERDSSTTRAGSTHGSLALNIPFPAWFAWPKVS